MKILHTSDWHLGHTLFGRKRHDEFQAFLDWLSDVIHREQIDALLISGDIFDSSLPSNQAQALYYRFLNRIASASCPCRHIVVTSGNHDSPSFLDAPRALLNTLGIHVIGRAQAPDQEVLTLCDAEGTPELIVCAVPFLRDRDLYRAEAGDTFEERDQKLLEGLRLHYQRCAAEAARRRADAQIPVIAMGHLFARGGRIAEEDGVKDVRVGSLGQVDASVFRGRFDYTALGHLHIPQTAGGDPCIRYSGSPLPMGFGEAGQRKEVCLIESCGRGLSISSMEVPVFQKLEVIKGDCAAIEKRLAELALSGENVWTEILCSDDTLAGDLRERLQKKAADNVEILRIRITGQGASSLEAGPESDALEDMDVFQVFHKKLQERFPDSTLEDEPCKSLSATFEEAMRSLQQEDESCAS